MTRKCVVPYCKSTHKTENSRFFRFPCLKSRLPKELAEKRWKCWLSALGFRPQYNTENKYVCNLHFVSGASAKPTKCSDVDWVPSLHMPDRGSVLSNAENDATVDLVQADQRNSQISNATTLRGGAMKESYGSDTSSGVTSGGSVSSAKNDATVDPVQADQYNSQVPEAADIILPHSRSFEKESSTQISMDDGYSVEYDEFCKELEECDHLIRAIHSSPKHIRTSDYQKSTVSSGSNESQRCGIIEASKQACENCKLLSHYRQELQQQFVRINYLTTELNKCRKGLAWLKDDEKCNRYTGISSYVILKKMYEFVKPYLFEASCELSKDEIFVMTLRKLRRNTQLEELADDYSICGNTASKYFHRTVKVLHDCLQYALELPSKEISIRHTPQVFKRYYGNRRVLVMDCFEVRTERPGKLKAANAHHSAYKMTHTTKFLIVMSADGSVAFVSKAYPGRCSDRFITVASGFLELIEPDDVILADKGFDIADLIESRGATLNIPTFLRKNTQMNPLKIERDRQITSLRVHVERIIGQIKSKYTYLNGTIQVNSLRRSENNDNTVDLIVRLACILVSFNKSIVRG